MYYKLAGTVVAVASIFYLYSTWVGKAMCADEFLTSSGIYYKKLHA